MNTFNKNFTKKSSLWSLLGCFELICNIFYWPKIIGKLYFGLKIPRKDLGVFIY